MHEGRIESNQTRGKGNKGKREQGNKQTSIYCMRWVLFVGVVFFFLPPRERHLVCFVDDDDDDDEARRQSDLSTFLGLIFFCSSALGMKKRKTCECGGVWCVVSVYMIESDGCFCIWETPESNSMAFFGGVFFFKQNWRTHTVVRYPTAVISQSVSQYIVLAHIRPRRIEKSHNMSHKARLPSARSGR